MNKIIMIFGVVIGLSLVYLAYLYFTTEARSLPSFLPGYNPNLTTTHLKHGIASLLLGLGFFALAWFQSGKKSSPK